MSVEKAGIHSNAGQVLQFVLFNSAHNHHQRALYQNPKLFFASLVSGQPSSPCQGTWPYSYPSSLCNRAKCSRFFSVALASA